MFIKLLVALIALEHIFILWVEMFAWNTTGKKIFKGMDEDLFEKTKVMAANQGLYNGFLAAGLIWSVFIHNSLWSFYTGTFFLSCVIIAGIYGAVTSSKQIFFKQALPSIIVLCLMLVTHL